MPSVFATSLKPLGDAFIKAIKLMVGPIIFTTVVVGIATMGDIRRVATVGLKALIYFEIVSTLALVIGMIVGNVLPLGVRMNIDPARSTPATSPVTSIRPSRSTLPIFC